MPTETRIYIVRNNHGHARLVRAPNLAQAIRHVSRGEFSGAVATPDELVDLASNGTKVEAAGDEPSADAKRQVAQAISDSIAMVQAADAEPTGTH